MHIATISYSISAFVYLVFFAVLLTDRHSGRNKLLLNAAVLASMIWSAYIALTTLSFSEYNLEQYVDVFELVKNIAWILFVLNMLFTSGFSGVGLSGRLGEKLRVVAVVIAAVSVLFFAVLYTDYVDVGIGVIVSLHLTASVVGIVLVEQLYRNVPEEQRWVIKYLCLGLVGSFIYNFYMYSDAMLYQRVDPILWQARGFVEASMLPLIAYSVSRDPMWSPEIFISRRVVFHTTTLLASAIYLFIMGIAGYYVKEYGGNWGAVIQAFLLFFTIVVLALILGSRRIRARMRVFVNKHFYPYKYDYREEWLRLIRTISLSSANLYRESIRSLAQIIDSPGGMLWLNSGHGYYECVESYNMDIIDEREPSESSLPQFIREYEFVINVDEYKSKPEMYTRLGALDLPPWVYDRKVWLIVPLINIDQLIGFVALDHSEETKKHFNWEDSDLLKTAARQVASYISQQKTSAALAEAKQFESFNKISTYIVHDIKNLVAQLSLIVSNSEKHRGNPLFLDDVINTIGNTVSKMNKMMDVVSNKTPSTHTNKINIIDLLEELVHSRELSRLLPVPLLGCESKEAYVRADKDQLMSIFGHIIQNAQDATSDTGEIRVTQSLDSNANIVIKISDTGCGMSDDFIKNYLFKPFKSTKGKGMGIGVYETREILSALGGTISVKSILKKGTEFTITLPPFE